MYCRLRYSANIVFIGLGFIDDGPVEDLDANVRLYDFLTEQNQRASHLMIGANPQYNSGLGDVDCHCTAKVPTTGGVISVNNRVPYLARQSV